MSRAIVRPAELDLDSPGRRDEIGVPHCWLTDLLTAYSLHLIATLPRALYIEFNVSQSDLTRGVCGGKLSLNDDGTVSIPDGPGIGVDVDADFIAAHRVN